MNFSICKSLSTLLLIFFAPVERTAAQSRGDLRLVQNGATSESFSAGRLEIFINTTWGSICADNFNITDATVACRQLGFSGALSVDTSFHTRYGLGTEGPVWLDEVDCSDESLLHLLSCQNHIGLGEENDCDHFSDVAVVCSEQPLLAQPRDLDVRLVGGEYRSAGRLEVYCNGEWGKVCDQQIFEKTEADAVCRQLGYTEASHFAVEANNGLQQQQQPTWFQQSSCPSEAKSIAECGTCLNLNSTAIPDCSAGATSSIVIQCSHDIPFGALRLVQGSTVVTPNVSEGRLEIFYDGHWGTVCSNNFDQTAADLACQQLGFIEAFNFKTSTSFNFGEGSGPIAITGVECTLQDRALSHCTEVPSENCTHAQDIALICTKYLPFTQQPGDNEGDRDSESKLLPLETFIGLLVGVCFLLVLCVVCCAVYSMHFRLVPYKKKKEQHNLYFIEREGSQIPELETDIDEKLPDEDVDPFAKEGDVTLLSAKKNSIKEDSKSDNSNRYVSYETIQRSVARTESQKAQNSKPLPELSPAAGGVQSPTVSSLRHASLTSLSSPLSLVPLPMESSQASLLSATSATASPVPTSIPIPPPLANKTQFSEAEGDTPLNLKTIGSLSESVPTLSTHSVNNTPQRKKNPAVAAAATYESTQSFQSEDSLATSYYTGSSQPLIKMTPTKGIIKPNVGVASSANMTRPEEKESPEVDTDKVCDDKEDPLPSDPTTTTTSPQRQQQHAHHVSFRLD